MKDKPFQDRRQLLIGGLLILLGLIFLLNTLEITHIDLGDVIVTLIALALIFWGVRLILWARRGKPLAHRSRLLGDLDLRIRGTVTEDFGAEVGLGELRLDLTEATVAPGEPVLARAHHPPGGLARRHRGATAPRSGRRRPRRGAPGQPAASGPQLRGLLPGRPDPFDRLPDHGGPAAYPGPSLDRRRQGHAGRVEPSECRRQSAVRRAGDATARLAPALQLQ